MKHIKIFENFDGPVYSGGDVTKMPIIGTITTLPFSFAEIEIPAATEDVVEIIEAPNNKKCYVINRWNKPRVPQLVHEDMVAKYEPKK